MIAKLAGYVWQAVAGARPRSAGPGLAAAGLLVAPLALGAQNADLAPDPGTISLTARGGLTIPVDSSSLDAITKSGGSFGGGISVHLTPAVALAGDIDYQLLEGDVDASGTKFPDFSALHATGGLEFHLLAPDTRWRGVLSVGAGVTNLEMNSRVDDGSLPPGDLRSVDIWNVSFRGGAELGYQFSRRINAFVEPAVYLVTLDRNDTQDIVDSSPALVDAFDVGWLIPVQAGVRVRIN